MSWDTTFIDRVFLVNLKKREDRFKEFFEMALEHNIVFERWEAIEYPNEGARGLRDTMQRLFVECLSRGYKNVMVFEDDALILRPDFNDIMDSVVRQIPANYDIVYGGSQPTIGFPEGFHSHNLLKLYKGFATHHCIYSESVMKYLAGTTWGYPIDNWLVDHIQTAGNCYQIYPFLTTQRAGFSDIGGQTWTWRPFLEIRFDQKIMEMKEKGRFNQPPL
jgi:hypothetical protein